MTGTSRMTLIVALLVAIAVSIGVVVRGDDLNGNGVEDRIDLAGTQPTSHPTGGTSIIHLIEPVTSCTGCHNVAPISLSRPIFPWSGSMMGNSARDPVFWAQLDVVEKDEHDLSPDIDGARDICLRCHIPRGWLDGRSSGSASAFQGMQMEPADLLGVQCEICHRMIDPLSTDDVDNLTIGDLVDVPPTYGAGMYVLDRKDVRRGPYSMDQVTWTELKDKFVEDGVDGKTAVQLWEDDVLSNQSPHWVKHSPFHRDGNLCGTCHDVSNPVWNPTNPLSAPFADKNDAQQNFPIERTWTEWKYSAYATMGEDGNCQSCHMSGPLTSTLGEPASFSSTTQAYPHPNDIHVHDLTGGNVFIPLVIADMISRYQILEGQAAPTDAVPARGAADRDQFLQDNYATILDTLYPGETFDPPDFGFDGAPSGFDARPYREASERAMETLRRAAELAADTPAPGDDLVVRLWNMTGHKLPTGYPEGRRMWLGVEFNDVDPTSGVETLVAESGQYDAADATLYHDFNIDGAAGGESYDIVTYQNADGTDFGSGRRTQVYESRSHHVSSDGSSPLHLAEFHFILNNERERDNRIPPLGWDKTQYQNNFADQVIATPYDASSGASFPQKAYTDTVPDSNFDEVPYPVPGASDVAEIRLWYQSVSREYVEALQGVGVDLAADVTDAVVYHDGTPADGYTRADILEHAWRTFSLGASLDIDSVTPAGPWTHLPPLEMTTLRVALIDADGDGLPDDWETAHGLDPNDATGNDGRHGDPDGDAQSNYIEFQNETDPGSADDLRDPLDLVLVLDFSGSMASDAPSGDTPKVDVLKDAVELFLKTWEPYATVNDRIGVIYFSDAVVIETGAIVDLSTSASIETSIQNLIDAVATRSAGGWTAMGGGLQDALNMLSSGSQRKHILLFTNGMQNFAPMVRDDGSGNYHIIRETPTPSDVQGDSGVLDTGGPAFGVNLDTLNRTIHTIGIGVSETADDKWVNLIKGIADDTGGLHQFVARAFELEGAFLQDLVQALRGFSPQMVKQVVSDLPRGQRSRTIEFQMDAAAKQATFVLSWAGAGGDAKSNQLDFELLTPDGSPALGLGRITGGAQYRIFNCYFPLAETDGRPVEHAGVWKLFVKRPKRSRTAGGDDVGVPSDTSTEIEFRAYLLADVPNSQVQAEFTRPRIQAGDDMVLWTAVTETAGPLRSLTNVQAEIIRPHTGLGTFVSQTDVSIDRVQAAMAAVTTDSFTDLAAAKTNLILTDATLAAAIAPTRETVQLFDDGDPAHGDSAASDGIFSARLTGLEAPGLLTANIEIEGHSTRSGDFTRRATASSLIGHADFIGGKTLFEGVLRDHLVNGRSLIQIKVTPRDTLGNYLGPGYADRVDIGILGFNPSTAVIDNLDGSYDREFEIPPASMDADVRIAVDDTVIYEDPVNALVLEDGAEVLDTSLDGAGGSTGISLWIVLLLVLIILILVLAFIWLITKWQST